MSEARLEMPVHGVTTVYRHEYKGKAFYSIRVWQKNWKGEGEVFYPAAEFRNDVEVEDKAKINIKRGWWKFYKGSDNHTHEVVFICDFEREEPLQAPQFEQVEEEMPF